MPVGSIAAESSTVHHARPLRGAAAEVLRQKRDAWGNAERVRQRIGAVMHGPSPWNFVRTTRLERRSARRSAAKDVVRHRPALGHAEVGLAVSVIRSGLEECPRRPLLLRRAPIARRLEVPLGTHASQQLPDQARLADPSLCGQQRVGPVAYSRLENIELTLPVKEAIPVDPVRPSFLSPPKVPPNGYVANGHAGKRYRSQILEWAAGQGRWRTVRTITVVDTPKPEVRERMGKHMRQLCRHGGGRRVAAPGRSLERPVATSRGRAGRIGPTCTDPTFTTTRTIPEGGVVHVQ